MYKELNGMNHSPTMGYVYVLYNPESNLVKIGMTKNPKERFLTLTNETGSKFKYYITKPMFIEFLVEKAMHSKFHRFNVKGEWYKNIDFETVASYLKDICDSEDFKKRNKLKQ